MRWRRIVVRRAVITVFFLAMLVFGTVQHDGLLIGFGIVGLIFSALLVAMFVWVWKEQQGKHEK